jgi:murein DD-endopeptidase MepM/ murein hydrolase activator NlpD
VSGFAWPINGAVTSGFGPRWGGTHSGIDIDCVTGDAIRASKSGSVVSATYDGGYGYHVVIDHGGGFASLYAHASELNVSGGQSVSQGDTIAACGSTGQSTGDHLHFEVRVNGAPQDPMGYLP